MNGLKLFVDANILVAAAKSSSGGSRLVLALGKSKKYNLVTVAHALQEAERNIALKLGAKYLPAYYNLLLESKVSIQPIFGSTLSEIVKLEKFVPRKDVPILLGVLYSESSFLITLDRKDFLKNEALHALRLPFKILTPGDFIQKYL